MKSFGAALALPLALLADAAGAAAFPCKPCAGVRSGDPMGVAAALATGVRGDAEARLFVGWDVALDGVADPAAAAAAVRAAGGVPWLRLRFTTPAPLAGAQRLEEELAAAAAAARALREGELAQVVWVPEGGAPAPAEYAYLLKRAAVAILGAQPEAEVVGGPLPAAPDSLAALYGEGVAAYLGAVALAPASAADLTAALAALAELDPGKPVVVDSLPHPAEALETLALAAEHAALGAALVAFDIPAGAELAPLQLLAAEFHGDLSFDPYSTPEGAAGAWAFARGADLGLRVVARPFPQGIAEGELVLRFADPQLRRPARVLPGGEVIPLAGVRRTAAGLEVRIADPGAAVVLRLERPTAAELEGVEGLAERVTVAGERALPVEEILRRLQAFEDAQARRLDHYRAVNTTHLRFRVGASSQAIEATFEGEFFFRRGSGFDWAWEELYLNGVRWRGKTIPEIPLVQPQKAAAMPLEILFTKEYRYALRGTETVDGRDCWVVEFAPLGGERGGELGERLHQGAVWIDRQLYARVRTRAVQLGLEGEVLSNEETLHYAPVDAAGRPAPWSPESYFLPLRVLGQQLLSVVNATTLVEKETLLTAVRVNDSEFAAARRAALASDVTMVRDTAKGLRYLVKAEDGEERVVKEGYDTDKLFVLGGVFYDDSLDFPLPLAGVDYFSFDFRGTGKQLNVFFAGALLTANWADPDVAGTRLDAGAQLFAIALPFGDSLFRGDREAPEEEVEVRPASLSLNLGRPLGSFVKLDATYQVTDLRYGRADDTATEFRPPSDNQTHSLSLGGRVSRGGYQLAVEGSYNRRSRWEAWGFPGNPAFDPDQREFLRWEARAGKTWYLKNFQHAGLEVDYLGGRDLDRFSKYQFGFFGGSRVHGYQSNRVRAEEALAAHLSYGVGLGELVRVDLQGDAAWATDEESGLERELLGGVGVAGTFVGPWQTVVNLDVGVPVAGPDDGFVAYIAVLKLFR